MLILIYAEMPTKEEADELHKLFVQKDQVKGKVHSRVIYKDLLISE